MDKAHENIVCSLRKNAACVRDIDTSKTPWPELKEDYCTPELWEDAADAIELLSLYKRFANGVISGQVIDELNYKKQHGRYTFEDPTS